MPKKIKMGVAGFLREGNLLIAQGEMGIKHDG